jgi:hypothetical protein
MKKIDVTMIVTDNSLNELGMKGWKRFMETRRGERKIIDYVARIGKENSCESPQEYLQFAKENMEDIARCATW